MLQVYRPKTQYENINYKSNVNVFDNLEAQKGGAYTFISVQKSTQDDLTGSLDRAMKNHSNLKNFYKKH